MFRNIFLVWILVCSLIVVGCSRNEDRPQVVIYTALDEMYSAPILDAFEAKTGIDVVPVYDTESSKTTGLVNRLLAEKDRPRADVFWNNEVIQTIVLKDKGVLAPYVSPSATTIPADFKDPEGCWAGLAARGRVIIYNTDLIQAPPHSIHDLLDPQWRGKAAIAKPLFGTTATHGASLFTLWGDEKTKAFFQGVKDNEIAVLPGNATVRDLVASGDYAWGLTDTDDANGAVVDGYPVKWHFPDQAEGEEGTLIIPNTVALIEGAPHSDAAKQLIDYLLSPEVEEILAQSRSLQIPLHPEAHAPESVPVLSEVKTYAIDFNDAAKQLDVSMRYMQEEFLQ